MQTVIVVSNCMPRLRTWATAGANDHGLRRDIVLSLILGQYRRISWEMVVAGRSDSVFGTCLEGPRKTGDGTEFLPLSRCREFLCSVLPSGATY